MARTYHQFVVTTLLAIGLVAAQGLGAPSATAQVFEDPGFGDPYATSSYGADGRSRTATPNPTVNGNYGPSAPVQPGSPSRPSSWPGGSTDPALGRQGNGAGPQAGYAPPGTMPQGALNAPPQYVASATPPQRPARPPKASPADPPYDPAEIVAHIGSEVVQASEVLPNINQAVAQVIAQKFDELAPDPEVREMQLNQFRQQMMKQSIDDMVKIKMLLTELRRKIPEEGLKKHEKMIRDHFNKVGIPRLMEMHKATSVIDLEHRLRELGSSLDVQRNVYIERELALGWLRQQIKEEEEPPTHEKMLEFYQQNIADWETPARARWEQITVKNDRFANKADAYRALAKWGNEIMRGAPFAEVAKANSQEYSAEEGGLHDWTNQGALRSAALDEALFKLPEGVLSQIIEDEEGYHIVRLLKREPATRRSFTDVQPEIKKRLQDGSKDKQRAEYLAHLREMIPVSTIFDDDFIANTTPQANTVTR